MEHDLTRIHCSKNRANFISSSHEYICIAFISSPFIGQGESRSSTFSPDIRQWLRNWSTLNKRGFINVLPIFSDEFFRKSHIPNIMKIASFHTSESKNEIVLPCTYSHTDFQIIFSFSTPINLTFIYVSIWAARYLAKGVITTMDISTLYSVSKNSYSTLCTHSFTPTWTDSLCFPDSLSSYRHCFLWDFFPMSWCKIMV